MSETVYCYIPSVRISEWLGADKRSMQTPPNVGTKPGIMSKKLEDVVHFRVVPADCRRRRVLCTDGRIL
jgi:hypothetical protein